MSYAVLTVRRLALFALTMSVVIGFASRSWAVTGLQQTTALGNLAFAFGEDEIKNDVGVWRDVHRLATGVWSSEGLQVAIE